MWLTIHAFLLMKTPDKDTYVPLYTYQCIPIILSVIFILPLFLINTNVIKRDEGFGFDDSNKWRRRFFFLLLTLNFMPLMGSLGGLLKPSPGDNLSNWPDVEICLGAGCCLISALILKLGTYKPKDDDSF